MTRINFNGRMYETETDLPALVEKISEYVANLPTEKCNHSCDVDWYEFDDLKKEIAELKEKLNKLLETKK